MKIQLGKYYVTRIRDVVGPVYKNTKRADINVSFDEFVADIVGLIADDGKPVRITFDKNGAWYDNSSEWAYDIVDEATPEQIAHAENFRGWAGGPVA